MAQKTYNTGRVVGWSSYEEFLKETGADPSQISRYIYQTMVTYGVTRIVELSPGNWLASNGGQFYTQTVRVPGASWGAVPIVGLDYTNYLDVLLDPTTSTESVEQTDALEKSDLEAAVKTIFTVYVSDENGKEATSPQSDHGYLTFAAYPDILEFDSKISGIPGATMRLIVRGLSLEDLDVDELYFGPQGLVFAGNAFGSGGSHEIKNISDLALNSAGYIWLSPGGAPTPVDYRGLVNHPAGQLLASTFGYLSQDFLNGEGEFADLGAYGFTYAEYLDAFNDPDIHIVATQLTAIPVEQRDDYVYLICGLQSYTDYPSAAYPLFVIPVDKQTGKVNIGNYDTFQKPATKKPIDFTRLYNANGDDAATLYLYDKKLPEYMGDWWGTNSVPYSDGLRYVGNNSLSGNWIDDDLSQVPSATFTRTGRHACWKLGEGNFHKGYLYVLLDQVGSEMNGVYLCTKDLDHDSQSYYQLNRCGCFIPWTFPQWYKDKVGSFAFEVDLTGISANVIDGVLYLDGSPIYPGEMAIIGSATDWRCVYVWETINQGQPRLIVDTSDTPAASFDATASTNIVQVTDAHSNRIRIPRTDWDIVRAGATVQVWTSESSSYNISTSSTEMTVGSFIRISHEKVGVWGCDESYLYVVLSCKNDYVHLASTMVWVDNPNLTTTVGYPGTYNAVVPRYNANLPDASGSYHYNIKAALTTIKAKKFFADFGWDILDYVDADYQNLSLGEFLQMCVTRSDLTVPRSAENYRNHGITSIFHLYSKEDMNYTTGVIPDPSVNQIDSSLTLSAKTEASSFFNTAWYSATTSDGEVDISNKDYPIWVTLAKSDSGEQTMSVSVLDDVNNLLDFTGNEGTVEADIITWLDLLTGLGSGKALDILHGLRFRRDADDIICIISPDGAKLYLGKDLPDGNIEEGSLAMAGGLYVYEDEEWVPVGGGGGGGSSSYEDLTHKPKINNHTLSGNKSATDLDLQPYITDPSEIGALPATAGYAGSATPGGPATQAQALTTSEGSATQPVYFANGVPVPTSYLLASSVPSNAVFTDMLAQAPNVGLSGNTDLNDLSNWSIFRHYYISAEASNTILNYPATRGVEATLWVIPNYKDIGSTHRTAQVIVPVNNEAIYIRQLESVDTEAPVFQITDWMRVAHIPSDAKFTDTTYESKPAAAGGTDVSLVTTGEKAIWNSKQDALTFDNSPTSGSSNPVKSGGIYSALDNKVDKVSGKGLSTNDYTTPEKEKLASLSNYDDTELRMALAEAIDSGAKNVFNTDTSVVNHASSSISDNTITVTGSGTWARVAYRISCAVGNNVLALTVDNLSSTACRISIAKNADSSQQLAYKDISAIGDVVLEFESDTDAVYVIFYVNNSSATGNTSVTVSDVMVCTEALWDITENYIPYAPTNRELYVNKADLKDVPALKPNITSSTSIAAYVDALSKGHYTAFFTSSSTPTDAPVADNCFVEIFVYSSNTALVRVLPTAVSQFSTFYEKIKISGTWRSWISYSDDTIIEAQIGAVANLGAKNLIPNTSTSQTKSNIIYTVASDGTVTVVIPASHGTSNVEFSVYGSASVPEELRGRTLILSGSPAGSTSTYRLILQNTTSGYSTIITASEGDSAPFTISDSITSIRLLFIVYPNCPAQTVVIKPMIRDAEIKDDQYEPYAMTNRELSVLPKTYTLGTALVQDTDLNDLTTPGKYYASNATIVGSISNKPVSSVAFFLMTIPSIAEARYIQVFIPNDDSGDWYKRRYAGSWQPWVKYTRQYEEMCFGSDIPKNSDLNDYTTPGVYQCTGSTVGETLSNSPTVNPYRLEVKNFTSSSNVLQEITSVVNTTSGEPIVYRRVKLSSGWKAWYKWPGTSV